MLDKKVKHTLTNMIIGCAIYNLVLFILSLVIFIIYCNIKKIDTATAFVFIEKNEIALILGFVWSAISMYVMAESIENGVSSKDEKYARNHVVIVNTVKLLIFCVILIIIIQKNVCGFSGGIMFALAVYGIKIGAYLTPLIEKKRNK